MSRSDDRLARLASVLLSRRGGDPDVSYAARLFSKGDDAILKKIGEEATELVMAAKDAQHNEAGGKQKVVAEMADLWFHCLVALAYYDLSPAQVLDELDQRAGVSGLEEKASRQTRRAQHDAARE